MALKDSDELVLNAVEEHYENNETPYYLAALGALFRSENIEIPNGVRFKDYLKSRYAGRLVVVQDEESPAKIAIAPLDKESIVRDQLSREYLDSPDGPSDSSVDYARLPFALVAAFCKIPLPGTRLYFRITRPFRYETHSQPPKDANLVEIEDKFRPPSLAGRPVREISYGDRQVIYSHIMKWAYEKSVDLRAIYYNRGSKPDSVRGPHFESNDNALQRLIDAQEPEIRGRIRIPGDIATALMELP